jgi:ribosomal protein S11
MIDVFHAIGACGDLIHYWDVAKRGEGGVVLRATSSRRFPSEHAAVEAAREIAQHVQPAGYTVLSVTAAGRGNGDPEAGWQALVELHIG